MSNLNILLDEYNEKKFINENEVICKVIWEHAIGMWKYYAYIHGENRAPSRIGFSTAPLDASVETIENKRC